MSYETRSFDFSGHKLVYDLYGKEGDRLVVYVHGLLLDSEMNRELAEGLADQGFRVVLLELLGHGRSDKPLHASQHRMDFASDQVVALLDELGADQAVLGGVSLGANVTLFAAVRHPERFKGLIVEMPVLEGAVPFAAMVFVPLMIVSHYTRFLDGPLRMLTSWVPKLPMGALNSIVNAVGMGSGERAAVLHGLITGPVTPTQEERATMDVPTLVIAHPLDPLHTFSDADNLAALLPDATLVQGAHLIDLRVFPERLINLVAQFAAERWDEGARMVTTSGEEPHPTIDLEDGAITLSGEHRRRLSEK